MSISEIILIVLGYFAVLMLIGHFTSRKSKSADFYLGGRKSPWYVVAFGMVGASLSGVTYLSVPGWVGAQEFSYMQMVLGYVAGYAVIALVLLPLYYKLQLTSIYTYLQGRFGEHSYKTGASFFLLSRIIGAAFRLYLVAIALDTVIFEPAGIQNSFVWSVIITVFLIWLYTFRGGIKTIIWTDTLQTFFMLSAVGLAIYSISTAMDLGGTSVWDMVAHSDYSKWLFTDNADFGNGNHFVQRFLAGMFIAIVMTGLDQDMMQKNLSCKNLKEAQYNVFSLAGVLVVVNLVFLGLGALLYLYAGKIGLDTSTFASDKLFIKIAMEGGLGKGVSIVFLLGLIAAAYSSADSALTSLTTSFMVDILGADKLEEEKQKRTRIMTHIVMSVVLILVILLFKAINDDAVISGIFKAAGYTYGPLLGLYAFGLYTKAKVLDRLVPLVCIVSPVLTYVLNANSEFLFGGYKFGFELLLVNGALTFIGMALISIKSDKTMPNLIDQNLG